MLSRDKRLPLDTRKLSEPQGNVFGKPCPLFDSPQTLYQGILHSATPCDTGAVPVQVRTGQLVARGEEQIGSTTTMPLSERRPSTHEFFIASGKIPQNSVAGQQTLQISELQFDKFAVPSSFIFWKIRFKTQVISCSDYPSNAVLWINEVEMVDSVDELKSSRSIAG